MRSELFRKIADLIAQNKIKEAFEELERANLPIDMTIEFAMLKSRWNENQQKERLRVITFDNYQVERLQIIRALLTFADRVPSEAIAPPQTQPIQIPDLKSQQDIHFSNKANLEKIIGDSSLAPLDWFTKMVEASRSVCRIVVENPQKGAWVGTGFLTDGGYLFTNHHVLENSEDAKYATLEFNYLSETSRRTTYKLNADTWVGDEGLDFARVKVLDNSSDPLSQWGALKIDQSASVAVNDAVPIIQHPEGQSMQVSIEGNFVKRVSSDGQFIYYTTDTMSGSSGSPVFNKDWKVIALHHAGMSGEDLNRGILFRKILDFLGGR